MKAERLIELICHPQAMSNDDLKELDTLIQRYPYFQGARVLYLRSLHLFANARFRSELKKNTVHIADHKQLYKYLNDLLEFDYLAPAGQPPKDASLTDIVTDRIREINGYLPVNTFGIPANRNHPASSGERDELINLDIREYAAPTPSGRPVPPAFSSGEQDPNVVSNPIMIEGIPGVISDYADAGGASRDTGFQDAVLQSFVIQSGIDTAGIPGFVDDTTEEEPVSPLFATPIELIEEQEEEEKEKKEEIFPGIESAYRLEYEGVPDQEIVSLGELAGELKKKQEEKTPRTPGKKSELIDRFIVEEPTIPRGLLHQVTEGDLYEESGREKEDLFSETLAKIYIKQGLYEKAIATYIKLSLKYPEKSVYFANRIEKIKAKTNNNE